MTMTPAEETELEVALYDVKTELRAAINHWPPINSAHEGWGVLMEECDELWDHVKLKQRNRNLHQMRHEAMQIAAVAIRIMLDVCNEERGRK